MNLAFTIVDVFTATAYAGNPLAIVHEAAEQPLQLTTDQMQTIARQMNLSETIFITAWDWAASRFAVRIFTPSKELPFAGHPSIGAAAWLAGRRQGTDRQIELMEAVGRIVCEAGWQNGRGHAALTPVALPQPQPVTGPASAEVAADLQVPHQAVVGDVEVWSAGLALHFLELQTPGLVAGIRPPAISGRLQAIDLACFAFGPGPDEVTTRVFPLAAGITEDPATGAAAVALAGRIAAKVLAGRDEAVIRVRQGAEMGRPSELRLHLHGDNGVLKAVRLSGDVISVAQGQLLHLP